MSSSSKLKSLPGRIALRMIPTKAPTARPEKSIVTLPIVKDMLPAELYLIPIESTRISAAIITLRDLEKST